MSLEYVTARFPEGKVEKVTDRKTALSRIFTFGDKDEDRIRQREAGGDFGPWREQREGMARVRTRSAGMPVGTKLIVQRESDLDQLSVRKVEKEPTVPDLGVHPKLEVIHYGVWDEYDVRSGGRWYCRFIDNTHTVSKHGYKEPNEEWLGAAEDVFVISGGMDQLKKVAFHIVQETVDGLYEAQTVIVERIIWTPQTGWQQYGGDTHYHVHVDVLGGVPCRP